MIFVEQHCIFRDDQRDARVGYFQPAALIVQDRHGEIAQVGVRRQRLQDVLVDEIEVILVGDRLAGQRGILEMMRGVRGRAQGDRVRMRVRRFRRVDLLVER